MLSDHFWLAEPHRLLEIAIAGVALYIFTVLFIRVLGKRATAQMNNFDWLIAVATGSLLASGILLRDISLAGALLAITILGLCQYVVTRFFSRSQEMASRLRANPTLLTHKGHWLDEAMRRERVTRAEVMARLRQEGLFGIDEANWVVLEMDGRLSVLPRADVELEDMEALDGVVCDTDAIGELEAKPVPDYAQPAG